MYFKPSVGRTLTHIHSFIIGLLVPKISGVSASLCDVTHAIIHYNSNCHLEITSVSCQKAMIPNVSVENYQKLHSAL